MIQPPPVTRVGAQRAAQHELAKSVYHRNSDPFVVRAVRWAGHLVDRALHHLQVVAPGGDFGALALVVIVVVLVTVVIWRVGAPRRAATTGAVLPTGQAASAAQHRALAEAAADHGDWHTAVIECMRAIARELEERSILEPRAGRTATELAREAGALLPTVTANLRQAAEVFNTIAYGGGEAEPAQLDVMIATDDGVRRSASSKVHAT